VGELGALADVGAIAHQYFAMNRFVGVLASIGVLVGSHTARVTGPRTIQTNCPNTAIAMGISGLWGAALTLSAERTRSLRELEQTTPPRGLGDTQLARAGRVAVVIVAQADALAPALAYSIVLPFTPAWPIGAVRVSYIAAVLVGLSTSSVQDVFLGRISRENLAISGLQTLSVGLLSI